MLKAEPASSSSSVAAVSRFEKRNISAPEIPGAKDWIGKLTQDPRPPKAVLKDLRRAKTHFANLLREGRQTVHDDAEVSRKVITPILRSENARAPGLNAVTCSNADEMGKVLRKLSQAGGPGQEGHVRFHMGVWEDSHRVAVDAFRHREGGFTLISVDSTPSPELTTHALSQLYKKNPDLIKGTMVIPTPNLLHDEGCRIYAVHHLNAMHDFQPHIQALHRELFDKGRDLPAPRLSGPKWKKDRRNIFVLPDGKNANSHVLSDAKDAFGLLPGKFFKHMQVRKASPGAGTLFDEAEGRNPALKDQPVNKRGQTLRERNASLNPEKAPEDFSRAERTLSVDKKRVALIDRAIEQYEGLAAQASSRPWPTRMADEMLRVVRSIFDGSKRIADSSMRIIRSFLQRSMNRAD